MSPTPDSPAKLPQRSRAQKILFPVLSILLSLAVSLILGELLLRAFRIQPERYNLPRWLAWDGAAFRESNVWGGGLIKRVSPFANQGVFMGEWVPGAVFKVAYDSNPRGYFDQDNAVRMTVNSLGLRGEEVSAEKPAGTCRILGIGDSFTFGYGVKDNDTYLHRLQMQLNANPPAQKRYEVLNAGVGGYNTRDEVLYLEHRWLALKPDVVLIVFYINDAYDEGAIFDLGEGLGIYRKKPPGLAQYSRLWDLAQHRYKTYLESKKLEAYYNEKCFVDARHFLENPNSDEYEGDWKTGYAALGRAAQLTRERNIKLGLVMFPDLYRLKQGYPFLQVHELVKESCHRLGIPYLDLLDTFRGHDAESLWVHPSDHHPNEMAHAMAEQAIEQFVRQQFLKSDPP